MLSLYITRDYHSLTQFDDTEILFSGLIVKGKLDYSSLYLLYHFTVCMGKSGTI